MNVRHAVAAALAVAATAFAGSMALAQDYPAKPIRFIVPFPPAKPWRR